MPPGLSRRNPDIVLTPPAEYRRRRTKPPGITACHATPSVSTATSYAGAKPAGSTPTAKPPSAATSPGIRAKLDLASALGILGAVLIGFGAMSFVAAHWNEMPRLFRLAMIFGGLFGAYGIAGVLFERKHPTFAHAAILAGVAIFGAGIMLIAQMFHIEGHPPDAVLTWALGALAAGVILQSNPALALAMLLVCLWSGWETTDGRGEVHWAFLLGWGAVTAAIAWQRWVGGLHLAAVAHVGLDHQPRLSAVRRARAWRRRRHRAADRRCRRRRAAGR